MRILLVHQAFVSPREAGGTRHFELASHCVEQGHHFTIVASDLNYLTGQPAGDEPEGYGPRLEGPRVLRAYTCPTIHRSFVWRVISFFSFMFSAVPVSLKAGPLDIVMGTSPPLFQAASAWLVAAIRRRPFLLEIRDLWPDFAIEMGVLKNPVAIRFSRWLENFLYSRATHLLVNSPAYRDYLIGKGISENKVSLIPNGVDPGMFYPDSSGSELRREMKLQDKFVVTYAGALGLANDLTTLLKAAEALRHEPSIHFLIVGDGKERANLTSLADELKLPNVTFTGSKSKTEIPKILAASDACVAILQDIRMFRTTYPNKVFDYMAAARPTILAIDGVIRDVVESAKGGVFVPPGDSQALAATVHRLSEERNDAKRMGQSARSYVRKHFNRQQQANDFLDLLKTLVPEPQPAARGFYVRTGKRVFDLLLTIPLLIFLLPVMGVLLFLVRFFLGSPAFFCQQRPGFNGQPFNLTKFRSMKEARDANGHLLPDAERLTAFGGFLRNTSLDELPELFCVLKGEMSLVGPRPLLMQYMTRYSPEQARRHTARPGLTGWAQVNGRNDISWEEKFALDVWYVKHQSLSLDLRIILRTIWLVLRRDGITTAGHATAPEFQGSKEGSILDQ
jgi:lipopolysaccharide/colanic/teichoic acid biosynthesis glycosyltransferase/glycosyltransferase involved in cell wall biosynthesis